MTTSEFDGTTPEGEAASVAEYEPGRGPGPVRLADEALSELLSSHQTGALATITSAGRPHLSTVAYRWEPVGRVVRISTTADRLKVRHLRRDPRAALYVSTADAVAFVVAEGRAELSAVSSVPGDETGRELLGLQPPLPDPEAEAVFLRNVVADGRLVVRIHVRRLYGTALGLS